MTTTGVDHYQSLTGDLAAWTAAAAVHVYLKSGLSRTEITAAIATVIAAGNAAAATLAVLFVRSLLERATRVPTPAADLPPVDDTARLRTAVSTIFDDTAAEPSAPSRLERLARSEVLDTGQQVVQDTISRSPVVTGWTRKLDADPCERCQRWAEDGRVFPKDHHFKRHFGCNCQMNIVTREGNTV
ncbi:hypothetical protein H7J93_13570 [Mycobacterium barrassiae]|uniref:VG15 protein n=1 Tax=Mycobacterium barrassiae TaxID=319709 RepID=UPI002265841F|nr:hypothetical protein [Mycobacterium barrassiae]MCV7300659.1 hypothetical protein [Mycobacterium barrassiae]